MLVHSAGALPGAGAFVDRLNRRGKPYYVLTNDAAKLAATATARYRGYGLPLEADRIITSGALLAPYFAAHGLVGRRCAVLGAADSIAYVELAGGQVVPAHEDFDVLAVCDESGYPFLDTVDAALKSIFRALARGSRVRLVLPDPDLIFPSPTGVGVASGSVARLAAAASANPSSSMVAGPAITEIDSARFRGRPNLTDPGIGIASVPESIRSSRDWPA